MELWLMMSLWLRERALPCEGTLVQLSPRRPSVEANAGFLGGLRNAVMPHWQPFYGPVALRHADSD